MYKKVFYIVPLLLIFLNACQVVQTTQIEIVRPAKISLSQNVNKVAIINNSIYNHTITDKDEFKESLIVLDSISSELLVALVADEMSRSPRFDSIVFISNSKIRSTKELLKPIKPEVIDFQLERNNVDAILSLEGINLEDTILSYYHSDGYTTVKHYDLGLMVTSFWRLYGNEGEASITEKIFSDTIVLSEVENIKHFAKIVKRKDGREWLAQQIMDQHFFSISDHVAPYWDQVPRYFYKGTNKEMNKAAEFALNDEWIKAAKIWKIYTESTKVKLASSACYNMALVCEVQGKIDLAMVWIDKSVALSSNYINKEYQQVLTARVAEENLLNKQFGIEN